MKIKVVLTSFLLVFACQASADVTRLNRSEIVMGNLSFSEAVKVENTLYLAGQVGLVPETQKLISGGIGEETRQTMSNIKKILEAHGYQLSEVVKCTVFLSDMKDFPTFNAAYKSYFQPEHLPARSTVGVNGLAMKAKVEVECFAAK